MIDGVTPQICDTSVCGDGADHVHIHAVGGDLDGRFAAAGLSHPAQIEARHLVRRMSASENKLYSQLHVFLEPGELLGGEVSGEFYSRMWVMARADSFEPAA